MPLAALRVLDLTTEIAGPYATKLLRDAGARVIKLEEPGAPDPLRRWSASHTPLAPGEDGALFRFLAAGKQSAAIDFASDAGRARVLELARSADVLVEARGPGGLDALGGKAALRAANPRLGVVSLSPWGLEGPWATRPATEMTQQAASGATGYRGLPERGPVGAGGRIGEWMAGPFVALGALFAWLHARTTGRGQHVDVSQFECVLASLTTLHDLQGQFLGVALKQVRQTQKNLFAPGRATFRPDAGGEHPAGVGDRAFYVFLFALGDLGQHAPVDRAHAVESFAGSRIHVAAIDKGLVAKYQGVGAGLPVGAGGRGFHGSGILGLAVNGADPADAPGCGLLLDPGTPARRPAAIRGFSSKGGRRTGADQYRFGAADIAKAVRLAAVEIIGFAGAEHTLEFAHSDFDRTADHHAALFAVVPQHVGAGIGV